MKFVLRPELERFVPGKLKCGQYADESKVMNKALEVLKGQCTVGRRRADLYAFSMTEQKLAEQPRSVADVPISELYKNHPFARTAGGTQYINIADEFVGWLGFANAGMLNKGNLLGFDYCLSHLPSLNPIVEVGVFCGLSTNLLNHYKRKHGAKNVFFNCDKWEFEGARGNVGDSPISHASYRAFVRDSYLRNVNTFSPGMLPHTVEAASDDFFKLWAAAEQATDVFGRRVKLGGPISFCYIDGNHTYEFAKRDFENADRFLEPGGFILFDDSADGSQWEVTQVIAEVKQMGNYRVINQNPNYLVQKTAK